MKCVHIVCMSDLHSCSGGHFMIWHSIVKYKLGISIWVIRKGEVKFEWQNMYIIRPNVDLSCFVSPLVSVVQWETKSQDKQQDGQIEATEMYSNIYNIINNSWRKDKINERLISSCISDTKFFWLTGKLSFRFFYLTSFLPLGFSRNMNAYIHSCPSCISDTYKLSPSARFSISDTTRPLIL